MGEKFKTADEVSTQNEKRLSCPRVISRLTTLERVKALVGTPAGLGHAVSRAARSQIGALEPNSLPREARRHICRLTRTPWCSRVPPPPIFQHTLTSQSTDSALCGLRRPPRCSEIATIATAVAYVTYTKRRER
jgi:hypothetical protein